jgi:anti-anti-sigma regulatory factor
MGITHTLPEEHLMDRSSDLSPENDVIPVPNATDYDSPADVLALREQVAQLQLRLQVYEHAFNGMPTGFKIYHLDDPDDPASLCLIFTNPAMRQVAGFAIDADIGKTIVAIFPNALESGLAQIYAEIARSGQKRDLGEVEYGDDRVTPATFAVRAFQLAQDYVCVMVENVTERKRVQAALRENILQEETIIAQAMALAELSTPLLAISTQVMVMPLIGSVDARRASQVIETLLQGVAETRAHIAILDITGVPVVDTQVADALIRAAASVKLLGAQVVLTGIRPEVAQTLVGLGIDISGIITCGSLQSGIAYAIAQQRGAPMPGAQRAGVLAR